MHARVVLGVGKGVLFREVSSVQECPHRERERFHCIPKDVTLFLVNSVSEFKIIVQFDQESKNCSELLVSYNNFIDLTHTPSHTHPHTHTHSLTHTLTHHTLTHTPHTTHTHCR